MFQRKVVENIKTHFVFSNAFTKIVHSGAVCCTLMNTVTQLALTLSTPQG